MYYGDDYIFSSREGCQQGCTLGSLLYVLSVSSVIKTLMAEFDDVLILGYIDDYYFLGEPARVAACYRRYNELMDERRSALNHGKGRFFSFSASASQHADVVALCRDMVAFSAV